MLAKGLYTTDSQVLCEAVSKLTPKTTTISIVILTCVQRDHLLLLCITCVCVAEVHGVMDTTNKDNIDSPANPINTGTPPPPSPPHTHSYLS